MQKGVIAVLVAILVLFGGWYVFSRYLVGKLDGNASVPQTQIYTSTALGISFDYPKSMKTEVRQDGTDERKWQTLVLLPKNYTPPQGGEGPPAITVSVFDNIEGVDISTWVRGDARSNFKLSSEQMLEDTTVGNEFAVEYTHSGLYETDAVAVAHGGRIYLFSVGWLTPQDRIRAEFQDMVSTVDFIKQ